MQITDAGAQMLLDSLAMDRSLIMLDLSSNQLTAKRCALRSVWCQRSCSSLRQCCGTLAKHLCNKVDLVVLSLRMHMLP